MKQIEADCLANLEETVKDPVLREKLRPHYRAACKRLIMSPDFYEAIQHPHAELVNTGIDAIEPTSIRTKDGVLHELDVLVLDEHDLARIGERAGALFVRHPRYQRIIPAVTNGEIVSAADIVPAQQPNELVALEHPRRIAERHVVGRSESPGYRPAGEYIYIIR